MIKYASSYSDFEEVKNGTGVVKIGATWCGPCRTLDSTFEDVVKEVDFTILSVDVDKFHQIAQELGVMTVPSTFLYKNGKLVDKFMGARSKDEVISKIKENLS